MVDLETENMATNEKDLPAMRHPDMTKAERDEFKTMEVRNPQLSN
jgi:hypothetical protein